MEYWFRTVDYDTVPETCSNHVYDKCESLLEWFKEMTLECKEKKINHINHIRKIS